jgi:hypothetical protein
MHKMKDGWTKVGNYKEKVSHVWTDNHINKLFCLRKKSVWIDPVGNCVRLIRSISRALHRNVVNQGIVQCDIRVPRIHAL